MIKCHKCGCIHNLVYSNYDNYEDRMIWLAQCHVICTNIMLSNVLVLIYRYHNISIHQNTLQHGLSSVTWIQWVIVTIVIVTIVTHSCTWNPFMYMKYVILYQYFSTRTYSNLSFQHSITTRTCTVHVRVAKYSTCTFTSSQVLCCTVLYMYMYEYSTCTCVCIYTVHDN